MTRPPMTRPPLTGRRDSTPTCSAPPAADGVSARFDADEPVFAAHPHWSGDAAGPRFGDAVWVASGLRRPANKIASVWILRFPDEDPIWNLRLREIAFCLFNPHHRVLRQAGVFPAARPAQFRTVAQTCQQLTHLARWAITSGKHNELRCWTAEDFDAFRADRASQVGPSSVTNAVTAVRHLIGLAPALTHEGPAQDPWPGRSAYQVGRRPPRTDLATPAIPPDTWSPLLHAAWTYIHVFAGDLLHARDQLNGPDRSGRPSRATQAVGRDRDQTLQTWLADPANLIPVRGRGHRRNGAAGTVHWTALARLVFGPDYRYAFNLNGSAAQRRRAMVEQVAAAGRTRTVDDTEPAAMSPTCSEFTTVTRADGTPGPWRERTSRLQLAQELRMLRAACYVFIVALSMMRDSEIQEIQRGAVTTHYGSPAVVSRKTKHAPATPEARWWIIEPVAEAIAVAERLSRHPTHLFANLRRPVPSSSGRAAGDPGINAAKAIDLFIDHVNRHRQHTGLPHIPIARVRPHMFRRTMAILTGAEPDAEIALGMQLKHAARRALANRTTPGYYSADENWIAEFDNHLETVAARKLVDLLQRRRCGDTVAVGPGAARLHEGLDNTLARLDNQTTLRAHHADERAEVTLLRDQFAGLHFGTINHCIFDPQQAACQNALPAEQRGHAPLLGACQPARCRNSVVTDTHAPLWLAEEADLTRMLANRRLAPPRREALHARLADVQHITAALTRQQEN
jgi:integrase